MLAFRRAACSSGRVVICGGPSSVCLILKRSCSSWANAYVRFHWANAQIWLHDEGLVRVRVRVRVRAGVGLGSGLGSGVGLGLGLGLAPR